MVPAWAALDSPPDAAKAQLVVVERIERGGAYNDQEIGDWVRDARRLATLEHPNVGRVRDIVIRGEEVLVVSDFLDGVRWSELTARAPARRSLRSGRAPRAGRRPFGPRCAAQPAGRPARAPQALSRGADPRVHRRRRRRHRPGRQRLPRQIGKGPTGTGRQRPTSRPRSCSRTTRPMRARTSTARASSSGRR